MNMVATPETMPVAPPSKDGEPTWEVALLFPVQGRWSEAEYLALETNHLVELCDGRLEFLPMPSLAHQFMVAFLYETLWAFVKPLALGSVLFAPLPVRLWARHLREPDVVFFKTGRFTDLHKPPDGADLVMEVVSPGEENRTRDLEDKRQDYAAAGIAEYWIVDPQEQHVIVLTLDGQTYREHGVFGHDTTATSVLFSGFSVVVDNVFSAGGV